MRDKIKEFFLVGSGNGGLTEEFIYKNQPQSEDNSVKVFSSSTIEQTSFKNIDKNAIFPDGKKLKIYKSEGVIIARNGKAGKMTYVNGGSYCLNDHAYILQVKEKYKKNINIRFVMHYLKSIITKFVTSDKKGNQTFNKTLFMECIVELPDIKQQNLYAEEFNNLENISVKIDACLEEMNQVLNRIPKATHGKYEQINTVFKLISEDRRLTEEYIYSHQGKYPVYSAQIEGEYGRINTFSFEGDVLTVVQYGDSGNVVLRQGKLNIGRNCCGLIPKPEYVDKVNMLYFKYALQNVFILNSKGESLKSLSQTTIKNTLFFMPKIEIQNAIAEELLRIENLKSNLQLVKKRLDFLL